MSTFNGLVEEFPEIRIDHFRTHSNRKPPSACFLSHVHSDHLMGLESLKMPFVYCSAATKRILLRMEKYPHRINYAKGILEARKQHYRHLGKVLRPLPLQVPVEIEVSPKSSLRVTLLDANHCPGAVMFLVEGSGKAILYTGDVRAEAWWVDSIVRNPMLLPYANGQKRLDCIYLDTTFASHDDIYKDFPSKSDGLTELLDKIGKCPSGTTFYFRAWTLGYEDVWLTLANALCANVHVDLYQLRLFRSLVDGGDSAATPEAPALAGYVVGNNAHSGCLTLDTSAKIHSCEPGSLCHAELLKNQNVVWITPIISRSKDGIEVLELGAGGGGGDLYQVSELEINDTIALHALQTLCGDIVKDKETRSRLIQSLIDAEQTGSKRMSLEGLELDPEVELTLKDFVEMVSRKGKWSSSAGPAPSETTATSGTRRKSDTIHFPYSRHSSYNELRHLVSAFWPKDICACTVELDNWCEDVSMESLFGDLCSTNAFAHDHEVRQLFQQQNELKQSIGKRKRKRNNSQSQDTQKSHSAGASDETDRQFKSAVSSPIVSDDHDAGAQPGQETIHEPVRQHEARGQKQENSVRKNQEYLQAIKHEYEKITKDSAPVLQTDERRADIEESPAIDGESQDSLSTSAFDSQAYNYVHTGGADDLTNTTCRPSQVRSSEHELESHATRITARKEAYHAANVILRDGNNSQWNDLYLRSLSSNGHTQKETEL